VADPDVIAEALRRHGEWMRRAEFRARVTRWVTDFLFLLLGVSVGWMVRLYVERPPGP
jgi:hypothetical protein